MEFAVQHLALEETLSLAPDTFLSQSSLFARVPKRLLQGLRLMLLLILVGTALLNLAYSFTVMAGWTSSLGDAFSRIASGFCSALLTLALIMFVDATVGGVVSCFNCTIPIVSPMCRLVSAFCKLSARLISRGMLGVDPTACEENNGKVSEWEGKAGLIIRSFETALAESERNITLIVKASERRLRQHENLIANEIKEEIHERADHVDAGPT